MNTLDVLDLLEFSSKSKDKQKILSDHRDNKQLVDLLLAALSFDRKFFIKNINEPEGVDADVDRHDDFMKLLSDLENRYVVGSAAQESVSLFLSTCNDQQIKWYTRIIKKGLRAGVDIASANKAGFEIPKFDVMLAKDAKDCKKLEEIVADGVFVSPKLDGYRCIADCHDGHVTLYSRNGSVYENFPSVVETLSKWCERSRFILDGEIMSDDFNSMQQSAFASKRGTTVGDVKFHVFGFIPHEEWKTSNFKTPTQLRLGNLQILFQTNSHHGDNVTVVPQKLVHNMDALRDLESEFVKQGFEGAMALPNIPYYWGRKSNSLMKFKSMLTQDCVVSGMYEGTGKYKGLLGGLTVTQEDGVTECDVGSGFTDQERRQIWKNKFDVLGRTLEVKYQELTPDGVMRFPVFLRWRNDK